MTIENTLSESEISNLLFMREEEKLARDVYNELYEEWDVDAFDNIASAEQSHMDSVKVILDNYGIDDPAQDESGSFTDPELQELYDDMIERGSNSLEDALSVGALIEEVDIQDLLQVIEETTNPELIEMYTNLLNGSYNHLNAFVDQLNSEGITYEPQILDEVVFNDIINNEDESGNSNAHGRSDSHGQSDSECSHETEDSGKGHTDSSHNEHGSQQSKFSVKDIESIMENEWGSELGSGFSAMRKNNINEESMLNIKNNVSNDFHYEVSETAEEQHMFINYDNAQLSNLQNEIQFMGMNNSNGQHANESFHDIFS